MSFGPNAHYHTLTYLTRLAKRSEGAIPHLKRALWDRLNAEAESAIAVALEVGDPLGSVLAEILQAKPDAKLAARIDGLIPQETTALRELGLIAAEQAFEELRTRQGIADVVKERNILRAQAANNLASRLGQLDRFEEALAALTESARLYREVGPDYRHKLALSLTNQALALIQLDRHAEAYPGAEEAVEILKAIATVHPDDPHLPELANSLMVLYGVFRELGRYDEALAANEDALKIYRGFAQGLPVDVFKQERAASLQNYSNLLAYLGRQEEALKAVEETVALYFDLSEDQPDAFRPSFVTALLLYSNQLSGLSRHEEALSVTQMAVGAYRSMAEPTHQRHIFLPDLASSLNNLANRLSYLNRFEEALLASEEAVRYYDELSQEHPDAFGAGFAVSLNTLARRLANVGRIREASTKAWEALVQLDPLFLQQPAKYASWMKLVRQDHVNFAQDAGAMPDWSRLSTLDWALERLQKQVLEQPAETGKLPCLPSEFIASIQVDGGVTAEMDHLIPPTRSLIQYLGYVQDGDFAMSDDLPMKRCRFLLRKGVEEEEVQRKAQRVETVLFRYTQVELDPEAKDRIQEIGEALDSCSAEAAVDAGLFAFIGGPERKPLLTKRLTQDDRERLDRGPTCLQPTPGARFRP
jgi:tetratricopeptide (TPR) repeat protein